MRATPFDSSLASYDRYNQVILYENLGGLNFDQHTVVMMQGGVDISVSET